MRLHIWFWQQMLQCDSDDQPKVWKVTKDLLLGSAASLLSWEQAGTHEKYRHSEAKAGDSTQWRSASVILLKHNVPLWGENPEAHNVSGLIEPSHSSPTAAFGENKHRVKMNLCFFSSYTLKTDCNNVCSSSDVSTSVHQNEWNRFYCIACFLHDPSWGFSPAVRRATKTLHRLLLFRTIAAPPVKK